MAKIQVLPKDMRDDSCLHFSPGVSNPDQETGIGYIHFTDSQSTDHHLDEVHGPPNMDHPFFTSGSTEFNLQ